MNETVEEEKAVAASTPTLTLGERMKGHEAQSRTVLAPRSYTIIRLDGRAFHTYTRGLKRPFDAAFAADMDTVAAEVAKEVSGCAFAYVQSDEISLLMTDFAAPGTQPWYGGVVPKLTSVTAALASVVLSELRPGKRATFDSRAFTVPDAGEVGAYLRWRQRDAIKNSTAMTGQVHLSAKELHGLNTDQVRERLVALGDPWDTYPAGFRYGRLVTRHVRRAPVTFVDKRTKQEHTVVADRTVWQAAPAPVFDEDWLARNIPVRPER